MVVMNYTVCEQLELSSKKYLFMFICLESKLNSNIKFGLDY